jgi:hypothetical protein
MASAVPCRIEDPALIPSLQKLSWRIRLLHPGVRPGAGFGRADRAFRLGRGLFTHASAASPAASAAAASAAFAYAIFAFAEIVAAQHASAQEQNA